MARFSEKLLRERPYLAPIKDYFAIPYAIEDAIFVAAVKGVCDPAPPFSAGVAVQHLVEAAYQSAKSGIAVKFRIPSNS
jgi:predicted dehydrogenase